MSGSSKNLNNYFLNSKIKQISANKGTRTTDNSPFKTDRLAKSASGTIRKDTTNSNITNSTTPKKNKIANKMEDLKDQLKGMKIIHRKLKDDYHFFKKDFVEVIAKLAQSKMTTKSRNPSTDKINQYNQETVNRLKIELDLTKKKYEDTIKDKDNQINELKNAYKKKSDEFKDYKQSYDFKKEEFRLLESNLAKAEKNVEENKKKLTKEIEKLEMEKINLENHYVHEIKSLKQQREENKNLLNSSRPVLKDRNFSPNRKHDIQVLVEEKDYYLFEYDKLKRIVEELKMEKYELWKKNENCQITISNLQKKTEDLNHDLDAMTNETKRLRIELEKNKLLEENSLKEEDEQPVQDSKNKCPLNISSLKKEVQKLKQNTRYPNKELTKNRSASALMAEISLNKDEANGSSTSRKLSPQKAAPTDKEITSKIKGLEKSNAELIFKNEFLKKENMNLNQKSAIKEIEIGNLRREIGLIKEKCKRMVPVASLQSNNEQIKHLKVIIENYDKDYKQILNEVERYKSQEKYKDHSNDSSKENYNNQNESHDESFKDQRSKPFERKDQYSRSLKEYQSNENSDQKELLNLKDNEIALLKEEVEDLNQIISNKEEAMGNMIRNFEENYRMLAFKFVEQSDQAFSNLENTLQGRGVQLDLIYSRLQRFRFHFTKNQKVEPKSMKISKFIDNISRNLDRAQSNLNEITYQDESTAAAYEALNENQDEDFSDDESNSFNEDQYIEQIKQLKNSISTQQQIIDNFEDEITNLKEQIYVKQGEKFMMEAKISSYQKDIQKHKEEIQVHKRTIDDLNNEIQKSKNAAVSPYRSKSDQREALLMNLGQQTKRDFEIENKEQEIRTLREILSHKEDIIDSLKLSEAYLEQKIRDKEKKLVKLEEILKSTKKLPNPTNNILNQKFSLKNYESC